MADVARLASVSSQTVSRVSNGQANVDEATRARVLEAMHTLGYRPNGAARALKSGRFHTIGVIMTTLQTLGNIRTLDAIATEAARADYSVLLMPISDRTLRGVSGAYRRLSAQAVDGAVIVLEARFLDRAEFALPPGIPVVVIDSARAPATPWSTPTRPSAPARPPSTSWASGTARSGTSPARRRRSPPLTAPSPGSAPSGGRHHPAAAAARQLDGGIGLPARPDPGRRADVTAIFAANDEMALGAMRALHELGRDIPADVSIVGFDDMDVSASFWPPLTTVRQDSPPSATSVSGNSWPRSPTPPRQRHHIVPTDLIIRGGAHQPALPPSPGSDLARVDIVAAWPCRPGRRPAFPAQRDNPLQCDDE